MSAEAKKEWRILACMLALFGAAFFLPTDSERFMMAINAALDLTKWYAREHVVLCLLPAFFIAGIIAVFVSKDAVVKYFGAHAPKWLSYSVAAISGSILAVCSCTVLPLFTSIYKRGAGLGPAVAFLYSGPAISILSMILTARILGVELGVARFVGAISFAIVIGLVMAFVFRHEESREEAHVMTFGQSAEARPMWQVAFHFFTLVLILVFANWGNPGNADSGLWAYIFAAKWYIVGALSVLLGYSLIYVLHLKHLNVLAGAMVTILSAVLAEQLMPSSPFVPLVSMLVAVAALSVLLLTDKGHADNRLWVMSSWHFAKQMLPLLGLGVLTAGFLFGSVHDDTMMAGVIPNEWIVQFLGDNTLQSNFCASFFGAFMYFATLTEVPIIQGLLASGMSKGPALALLLAGPSLSLPNMLVIRGVLGTKKTAVYMLLVIVMATITGYIYGLLF